MAGRSVAVLRVFGLLAVLATVAIMVFLAVKVLSTTTDDVPAGVIGLGNDPSPVAEDPTPGATQANPATPEDPAVQAAAAAACATERASIETAVETYEITNGGAPADLAQLVASGYLVQPEHGLSFQLGPDGTLEGIGACAGT